MPSVLHAELVLSQQFNENNNPPWKQWHQLLFLHALFVHEYSDFKATFNIAVSCHTAQQLPTSLLHTHHPNSEASQKWNIFSGSWNVVIKALVVFSLSSHFLQKKGPFQSEVSSS